VIFHSLDFVVFFIAFTAVYWCCSHRVQNLLLFAGSYFFYGYVHLWFLTLIASSTVIDYCAARAMEARPQHRRTFLALSMVTNVGLLGFFKYFDFFVDNVAAALTAAGAPVDLPVLRVLLPVGISFYTFQAMSYTVDVYKGELHARRSLLDVAVFVSFFPHLVAGPIQRASFLLPQVEGARRFDVDRARSGFGLICWGFFKKLVIADNVGVIANKVFSLADPSFPVLWAGVFAFAIQILADFSAYTDIARGTSRWLGFELTENFDHPYLAQSPSDFWRRWNISLSTWFRDYVYIPLGGSKAGGWKWARNVLATFLLSGLWHGASWNYVLWGAYHGVLLVAARARAILAPSLPPDSLRAKGGAAVWKPIVRILRIAGMFVLTLIGWLFFRETELDAIVRDLRLSPFAASAEELQIGVYLFLLAFVYSLPLWVQGIWVEIHRDAAGIRQPAALVGPGWPRLVLNGAACGAAFAAMLVFRSRTALDFIYFQF
jgi:alginate O-acetyltransferase complex protein AlgI